MLRTPKWVGIAVLLVLDVSVCTGFNGDQTSANPYLPDSNWPTLEAAKAASGGRVGVFVLEDLQIAPFEEGIEYWECELAADATDPKHLVATSMMLTPDSLQKSSRAFDLAGFYSHDGGASWKRGFVLTADKASDDWNARESYGDPTVSFGRGNSVHLVVMFKKRLEFWDSHDRGRKWIKRATVPREVDRPFTIVDLKGRQYTIGNINSPRGRLSDVIVYMDQDNSRKIGPGTIMAREFTNPRPANPALLHGGLVLLAAEDFHPKWMGTVRPDTARQIWTFRCEDGEMIKPGSKVNAQWSHESLGHVRPWKTFFPRLGANAFSSRFVDHVYCVWANGRIDGERIFVSVSRDKGETWSQPVVISEQPMSAGHDQEYLTAIPSVAVNRHGVVAVSWYDRRGLPKSVPTGKGRDREVHGWNVRARMSLDGGESWLPSVQLNSAQSHGNFDVGHTTGLAASPDGRFHALWVDSRHGARQLRTVAFGTN